MTMSKKAIFLTNHTEDWLRASSRWSPTTSSTSKRFLRSYVLLVSLSFRRLLNERSSCSTARPILRWHSSSMYSAFNSKNNWLPIWTNWSDPFISICVIPVLASFSIISLNPYSLLFFSYSLSSLWAMTTAMWKSMMISLEPISLRYSILLLSHSQDCWAGLPTLYAQHDSVSDTPFSFEEWWPSTAHPLLKSTFPSLFLTLGLWHAHGRMYCLF